MPGPAALTAAERARVDNLVRGADPDLADRVSLELDGGPVARAVAQLDASLSERVRSLETALAADIRQMRNITVIVMVVSMGLNAALVGVQMSLRWADAEVSTAGAQP